MENNLTKIKKLEKQLTAAVFLFFILIIGFLAMYDSGSKEALAITGDYSKGATAGLTAVDWNKLDDDFVAKDGDATLGNLNLNAVLDHNVDSPFYINSNDGLQLRINSNGGISNFGINNSSNSRLFTITNDGRVGIRTDNPEIYNLAVVGQTRLISDVGQLRLSNSPSYLNVDFTVNLDGNLEIIGSNGVPGNVGIGVINPQVKLDVGGDLKVRNNIWDGGSCMEIHWSGTSSGRSVECPDGKYMTKFRFARDNDNEFWATCCGL